MSSKKRISWIVFVDFLCLFCAERTTVFVDDWFDNVCFLSRDVSVGDLTCTFAIYAGLVMLMGTVFSFRKNMGSNFKLSVFNLIFQIVCCAELVLKNQSRLNFYILLSLLVD